MAPPESSASEAQGPEPSHMQPVSPPTCYLLLAYLRLRQNSSPVFHWSIPLNDAPAPS